MSSSGQAPIDFVARMVGDAETAGKLQSLGGAFGNFGKQADSAAGSMNKAERSTKSIGSAMKDSALSFSAAAANITNLAFQYGDLEKSQQRVEKAESTLLSSEASLAAAKVTLGNLVKRGITDGAAYESAQLRVASSQERLRVATTDVTIAQGDLEEANVRFAMSVLPTVLSSVTAVTQGINAFKGTSLAAAIGTRTLGASSLLLAPTLGASGAAATGASFGFRAMAGGIRTALLALGPVGWAITGVSIAATLLATNAFGIRDAFVSTGKAIHEFINQYFKPLGDLITWVIDGLNTLGAGLESGLAPAFGDAGSATDEFANETVNAGNAIIRTTDELKTYITYLEDLQAETTNSVRENMWFIQSVDEQLASLVRTGDEINLVASFLRSQQAEVARTAEENFKLVASVQDLDSAMRAFRDGSLSTVAAGLREIEDGATKATDAIGNLQNKAGAGTSVKEGISSNISSWWKGRRSDAQRALDASRAGSITQHANGGIINEKIIGVGLSTGRLHSFGESGPEAIVPLGSGVATLPPSSGGHSGGRTTQIIQLVVDKRVLAEVVNDANASQFP